MHALMLRTRKRQGGPPESLDGESQHLVRHAFLRNVPAFTSVEHTNAHTFFLSVALQMITPKCAMFLRLKFWCYTVSKAACSWTQALLGRIRKSPFLTALEAMGPCTTVVCGTSRLKAEWIFNHALEGSVRKSPPHVLTCAAGAQLSVSVFSPKLVPSCGFSEEVLAAVSRSCQQQRVQENKCTYPTKAHFTMQASRAGSTSDEGRSSSSSESFARVPCQG